jgi:CubicO group peptidase (beta-lactamase class C family)
VGVIEVIRNLDKLHELLPKLLESARIPGGALAMVVKGELVFAEGFGYRDMSNQLPVTAATMYPIGSTTKALNATLIGMLVDEGKLGWDVPVQRYLPRFQLQDSLASMQVTVRDLLALRTGLPRHDWVWGESSLTRPELVDCLCHLPLTAGFREKFQYNNLTPIVAAHLAEVVAAEPWETLIQSRILDPLSMSLTQLELPEAAEVTLAYHENARRELLPSRRFVEPVAAPAGSLIHSTVTDMARWMIFNLNAGRAAGGALIAPRTLAEIHTPQVVVSPEASGFKFNETYAMGWHVDSYCGSPRLFHGGYFYDISSAIALFPKEQVGIVSFTNFGPPSLSRAINECAFDVLMDRARSGAIEDRLTQYERMITETSLRLSSCIRVENAAASHRAGEYIGVYEHAAYGRIEITAGEGDLVFRRKNLVLPLQHWHYDAWIAKEHESFHIHSSHPFDRTSQIVFDTGPKGNIAGMSIQLEPAVAPIRFVKQTG